MRTPDLPWRRELRALERECDLELRGEGYLSLARRLESRGDENAAVEVYRRIDLENYSSELRRRAEARLAILAGEGNFGARIERGCRHFFTEVGDPAALGAMAIGGLAFRATRMAVLGRLAASPPSILSRGWAARSAASLAGYAAEAPLFALSAKLGHQALGRPQEWNGSTLGRELGASYLFLGALRLSGALASTVYRRIGGTPGSPWQALFTQGGMLAGILGAHALEAQVGLAPQRDRISVLADSLVLLLQFNIAGRLSQRLLGESGRSLERDLDLRGEALARPEIFASQIAPPILGDFAWQTGGAASEGRRPISEMLPASPNERSPATRTRARSAEEAVRQLLGEAIPLEESAKRGVLRRVQAGDPKAKDDLIRSDIRYVYQWARRYGFRGQTMLDALQEGSMGLVEAAGRFDFREVQFLTYATWWIRHSLTRFAANHLRHIRVPVHQLDLVRHLEREVRELRAGNVEIDPADLAERMQITEEKLEDLRNIDRSRYVEAMDAKRGTSEDGFDLHEVLPDTRPFADELLIGRRLRFLVEGFIDRQADETDRMLLHNRLVAESELSVGEIAQRLGLSVAPVKRREALLLRRLQLHLESHGVTGSEGKPSTRTAVGREPRLKNLGLGNGGSSILPATETGSSAARRRIQPQPRIAIVGFGMSGVGAANALRNARLFSEDGAGFSPRITVFEGMHRVGGKVAPDNLGAQFLDVEHFYPMDRLIQEHGLETTKPRRDYDFAAYLNPSGSTLSGNQFIQALRILRQAAREALRSQSWEELDRRSAVDFISELGQRNGPLSVEEVEAMVARLGFEEGTLNVSALSYAINLAKSSTPMARYEVVGGLHRLAEAEVGAVIAAGGEVRLGQPVRGVQALDEGVRLLFDGGDGARAESFDYAILALAPEHLRGFEVSGSRMPVDSLSSLEPAHIRKTNLRSHLLPPREEIADSRFARWNSPDPLSPRLPMVTFFHGWNGQAHLSLREMMIQAYGRKDVEAMIQVNEQIWDGRPQDGIPHYYTTLPQPGAGYAVARFAMDQYFLGRYDAERLRVANHTLGLGCYTRDGALAGELAALSLMRGAGLNLERGFSQRPDLQRYLLAAEKIR